ncbi:MAG: Crp/Fnr family transcriptional regulator [Paracoccaceae bacterium]
MDYLSMLSNPEIARICGVFGAGLYICSYFSLQSGLVKGQGFLYPSMNLIAASSVLFSLTANFNLAALIIQVSFITISVFGMTRIYLLTRAVRFTPDEKRFIDNYLTDLRPHQARRLMDTSSIRTVQKGDCLIREGETVENLIYILQGQVSIWMEGHQVNVCGDGQMLGELTFGIGMQATAKVVADESTKCIVFDGQKLAALMTRNHEINSALLASHFCSTRDKLIGSNSRHIEMFGAPAQVPHGADPIRPAQPVFRQP